jgi:hypothetical protein
MRMTVKILLPAYGKRGSSIISADGQMRVVDNPKPACHGYTSGCVCENCLTRAKAADAKRDPVVPPRRSCECDRPFGLVEGDCAKCGRAIPGEPARKAA